MDISKENKILLLILLAVIAFWIFSGKKSTANNNQLKQQVTSNNFDDKIDNSEEMEHFDSESNISANDSNFSENSNSENSQIKFDDYIKSSSEESNLASNLQYNTLSNSQTQEQAENNYKSVSFSKGDRGTKSNELDKFFEGSYPKNSSNNNGFSPTVENDIGAAYTPGKPEKLSDKDKFNPDSLLPREKNSDWVDDPYEQVTTKSSMLGNIFRPVGINSVQSTKKISSHDIRGVPKAPKFNVSPWNNSSVDGDTNIRNDSLCV